MTDPCPRPMPRHPVPDLAVATVDGSLWRLTERRPERFTLVVAYRGRHCPICRAYLQELVRLLPEFAARGVDVLAVSADDEARARDAHREWRLEGLALGYGLSIATGRAWGLYVSTGRGATSIGIEEPALFTEPGLFLVRPDGTLYWAAIQTMPFARPGFADVLKALDFVIAKDYPARGEA